MARPIVLSNGNLHVGINWYGLVHDFYYPYVGFENHAAGKSLRHRIGVWIDGTISWLDDGSWNFTFTYPQDALIGNIRAKNDNLNVLLEFEDWVDSDHDVFLRNIHVVNLVSNPREIRLFMHQAFVIGDTRSYTDTGQYLPDSHAILHYKGHRAFVIGGDHKGEAFDQYTIGLFGIEGREGTYKDAEDGELENNPVEHGEVDSTIRFRLEVGGHSSERVHYWIAAGTSTGHALAVHREVAESGLLSSLRHTAGWWQRWLKPALQVTPKLPADHRKSFVTSLMIIKSQIDRRGAVMASTDTGVLNYWRDAYAYCWPRDGAYTIWPLIRLGYTDEPQRFFEFCFEGLHPAGYLMHKYRADGALGSSWHPYVHDGEVAPPIQEDETALVLFVFEQFYRTHHDKLLLDTYYETMVVPMANFLANYIEPITGLPRPSYDLWEEVFLTTTYTTAVTYAALLAAADLAEAAHDADHAVAWRTSAEDMYEAAHRHLYNEERKAFYKGIIVKDKEIVYDETLDMSSLFGVFMFGLFPINSSEFTAAAKTYTDTFTSPEGIGLPRYENDNYMREPDGQSNWWYVCSLWMAEYAIEAGDTERAERILAWVRDHASSTGMLSEQLSPRTDRPLSIEPLTWSHAEYIACLLDMISEAKI